MVFTPKSLVRDTLDAVVEERFPDITVKERADTVEEMVDALGQVIDLFDDYEEQE